MPKWNQKCCTKRISDELIQHLRIRIWRDNVASHSAHPKENMYATILDIYSLVDKKPPKWHPLRRPSYPQTHPKKSLCPISHLFWDALFKPSTSWPAITITYFNNLPPPRSPISPFVLQPSTLYSILCYQHRKPQTPSIHQHPPTQ
jgi:hypothetical protein